MTSAQVSAPSSALAVERVLGVPTRAGIYRRLRAETAPVTATEVARMFGLHPNVARTHLDTLAGAGLVVTGRRKHARGGRPAKVYVAREEADRAPATPPEAAAATVGLLLQALRDVPGGAAAAEQAAEEFGRRAVGAAAGRADERDLEAAVVVAVEALRAVFPEVRQAGRVGDDDAAFVVEGLAEGLRLAGDPGVVDALARGLVSGAVDAAGAAAEVTADAGRVVIAHDEPRVRRAVARRTVDARGQTLQAGVVATMRAIMSVAPGEHLEVFTDTKGAPAAFARWADRAGHQVVDVARVRDVRGRATVRLLLRRAQRPGGRRGRAGP